MWHRLKPALALVLLLPLIAEYLLGSLSFKQLVLFPIMALMYGAGALIVREAARRAGRGWPTILLLGLAYGVVEEGLATQSLFNPHYLGLRLLDYGFIPALGIGAPWTVYVVTLHVVWSVAVPIALVESVFADHRTAPWLGRIGFGVSGLLYMAGVALITFGSHEKEKFWASSTQLVVTAVVALVAVAAAFGPRRRPAEPAVAATTGSAGRPFALGVVAFVAGSVFHLVMQLGSSYLVPWVAVTTALGLPSGMIALVRRAEKSAGWSDAHVDALMLGGLLAYGWLGFFLTVRLHGAASIPGQFFPFTIVMALVYWRFGGRPGRAKKEPAG